METAKEALNSVFDWAETNDFRRKGRRLAQEITFYEDQKKRLKNEIDDLNGQLRKTPRESSPRKQG